MKKITEPEIRELLGAHMGYLPFLKKMSHDCNRKDIIFLHEKLKEKQVLKFLPKQVMQYKDYYSLLFDMHKASKKYTAHRFIKENISKANREHLFLLLAEEPELLMTIYRISQQEKRAEIFARWSSRIKSVESAKTYIRSFSNKGSNDCFIDNGFVMKLESRETLRLCPPSWCLHQGSYFEQYTSKYNIYLVLFDGEIYGVNFYRNGWSIDSIITMKNSNLRKGYIWDGVLEILRERFPGEYIEGYNHLGQPEPVENRKVKDPIDLNRIGIRVENRQPRGFVEILVLEIMPILLPMMAIITFAMIIGSVLVK